MKLQHFIKLAQLIYYMHIVFSFTEMAQKPMPPTTAKRAAPRTETLSQASAKNRRLAEQMSKRSGVMTLDDDDDDV